MSVPPLAGPEVGLILVTANGAGLCWVGGCCVGCVVGDGCWVGCVVGGCWVAGAIRLCCVIVLMMLSSRVLLSGSFVWKHDDAVTASRSVGSTRAPAIGTVQVTVGVVPPLSSELVPTTKAPKSANVSCGPNRGSGCQLVAWMLAASGNTGKPPDQFRACHPSVLPMSVRMPFMPGSSRSLMTWQSASMAPEGLTCCLAPCLPVPAEFSEPPKAQYAPIAWLSHPRGPVALLSSHDPRKGVPSVKTAAMSLEAESRLLAYSVTRPPIEWAMMITLWPALPATHSIAWARSCPGPGAGGPVTHESVLPAWNPEYLDQSKV